MLPKPISKLKTGRKSTYLLPIVCASGLLLVCGMMISPVNNISKKAHATSTTTGGATTGGSGNTGTTTTPASVSMVFDENTAPNEQVDVVAGTPVASNAKYFTITPSGSVEKYSIYVQTSSSSNGSLVASNTNNNATIATLADKTTGVPLSSLGTNTWGYALSTGRQTTSNMLYKGLSGSTNAISAYDSTANPTSAQDFTLAFAANIGTDKPADHYIANVLVSVAANPGEVTSSFSDAVYMQDLTVSACQDAEIGVTKQLIDRRDTKSYWVAKLDDGNCWMTQNLALNLNGKTLTASDSDVSANWSGASGVSSALWSDTGANVIKWYASGTGSGRAGYGNHYSWEAATAGTGNKVTTNGANASNSICPKNWKLPTKDQFVTLAGGLNPATIQVAPYYFVFGGGVYSGKLNGAGNSGFYWSSTATSSTGAYGLSFGSSSVNPSYNTGRYAGFPVRCLVQGS